MALLGCSHILSSSRSFNVYDADAYSPARFLLPIRTAASQSVTVNGSAATSPAPGSPGRWKLDQDLGGLDRAAAMMTRTQSMYNMYTTYYLLQSIVLIGLMFRLIM